MSTVCQALGKAAWHNRLLWSGVLGVFLNEVPHFDANEKDSEALMKRKWLNSFCVILGVRKTGMQSRDSVCFTISLCCGLYC